MVEDYPEGSVQRILRRLHRRAQVRTRVSYQWTCTEWRSRCEEWGASMWGAVSMAEHKHCHCPCPGSPDGSPLQKRHSNELPIQRPLASYKETFVCISTSDGVNPSQSRHFHGTFPQSFFLEARVISRNLLETQRKHREDKGSVKTHAQRHSLNVWTTQNTLLDMQWFNPDPENCTACQ